MPKVKKNKLPKPFLSSNLFPVVGIGASAGGLDAFKRLLKSIPEKSGMAYILVQHLDPTHESILPNLLQRVTKIPVHQVTNNVHVKADNIYIIPSNKLLTATDGVLKLAARQMKQRNMPIDLFFASLAEVHQRHAIGVVLSGTGKDGTHGLSCIKKNGGVTFAQEQQSAAYEGMPQSAIDAEVVDFILAPEKIPKQLLSLRGSSEIVPASGKTSAIEEEGFNQILSYLNTKKGVDFSFYKQTTIRRRISRRVALSLRENNSTYLSYLKENTEELDALYQDLLIPVTQFFRDPQMFEAVKNKVFPAVFKNKPRNIPFRLWIAGCSTGEEAYSYVICLHEFLKHVSMGYKIQVFATDISEIAIKRARSGIYKADQLNGVSAIRLKNFFTKTDTNYRINKSIRDSIIFAHHNFLKDPPFAKMDIVSCRNALIYIEPSLQKKALTTFHYALNEKGTLILGKSETAGYTSELFHIKDKTNKIYNRKTFKGRFFQEFVEQNEGMASVTKEIANKQLIKEGFHANADEVLLLKYAPAGVIVNNDLEIVQFRGATGKWLEQSNGKPSLQVLKMVREGLAFELRTALHKVKLNKDAIVVRDIPMIFMGKEIFVNIDVIPLSKSSEPYFLILFSEPSVLPENSNDFLPKNNGKRVTGSKEKTYQVKLGKLQSELARTRVDMNAITEDQQAFNEELQSANEELLSGSEELQSLNEELETSKEEIQTSNEELIVVNQELIDRNEQLNLSRLYAESIVSTISEPLLILNKSLQVRTANKSFYNRFQTSEEGTKGKYLHELGEGQWNIPVLLALLKKIIPNKSSMVDFEVVTSFSGMGERVLLLNATQILRDNVEEKSILLAFDDITEKRRIDTELQMFAEKLEKQVVERTISLHESNIDLQHSNKNLEQFAYIASHDLQEPLRKIRVFSTMLQDRYKSELPDAAKDLVTKITNSSERMSSLIHELLNFSKVLHGNSAYEKTNLNDIVTDIATDFDLLIQEKKAVVKYGRMPVIDAIPLQINQLFYNLFSNSLKFSRKEIVPVISISSRFLKPQELKKYKTLNPRKQYCQISFKDNGIGFEQEFADKIFLIFHRLNGREQYSGTGIGLALCKTIVNNHHGEIVAVSNKNKGSEFKVILPSKN